MVKISTSYLRAKVMEYPGKAAEFSISGICVRIQGQLTNVVNSNKNFDIFYNNQKLMQFPQLMLF